jgi:large subunit ribosomal protein L1
MKRSKRFRTSSEMVDRSKYYSLEEGVELIKKTATAGFDESIEISINLGVDPRHADQMVRGTVSFPHGTGKEVKVLVLTKEPRWDEAKEAGADFVGLDDFVDKIKSGWFEMDSVIATPDVMAVVGKLGKVLGPRGLMPNPKVGTVTNDLTDAVRQIKAGRIDFRVDKYGILHVIVGRASFETSQLRENLIAFLDKVMRLRPAASKGAYVKAVTISSTMGPGIKIDRQQALALLK